jgi:hypothetical protein
MTKIKLLIPAGAEYGTCAAERLGSVTEDGVVILPPEAP